MFLNSEKAKVYGLAGINFTFWKVKITASDLGLDQYEIDETDLENPELITPYAPGDIETKGTEFGFNLGVGARFPVAKNLSIQAETKYTISSFGFISLGGGILYQF